MKTDKRTQLLKILSDASQSISSAALANMLGTSERTVRNYIKAINEEGKAVITSSREATVWKAILPVWTPCPTKPNPASGRFSLIY